MNYKEMILGLKTGDQDALIEVVRSYHPVMLNTKGWIYNIPDYGAVIVPVDIYISTNLDDLSEIVNKEEDINNE